MDLYTQYYTKMLKAYRKCLDPLNSVETIDQLKSAQEMCNAWVLLVKNYYDQLRKHRFSITGHRQMKQFGNMTVLMYQDMQATNEMVTHSFDEEPAYEGHYKPVKIKNLYDKIN